MKKWSWIFVGFLSLGVRADDLRFPEEPLIRQRVSALASEQIEERRNAKTQLEEWAERFPRHLLQTLAAEYSTRPDLEIRVQLEQMLRALGGRVLFYQPKAFLGVNFEWSLLPDGRKVIRFVNVVQGSPAERAGLRAGDAVIEVGGVRVELYKDPSDFAFQIQQQLPLESLRLRVLRNDKEFWAEVILAVNKSLPYTSASRIAEEEAEIEAWLKALRPPPDKSEAGPVGDFRMD